MTLRIPLAGPLRAEYVAVDVRLRDGSIVENLAIDSTGLILGKIVGGHDGVDGSPLPFKQEDMGDYRFRAGLASWFGLAKWRRV
jgi:hypothetical protein